MACKPNSRGMQFQSLNVSAGGLSEGFGPALLDFFLWELCFSLVSSLWESCYSLASCKGIFLERAVPFMYRLFHFMFFFFFLFSFSFSFFFIFSSTSHSPLSLSFRKNSFHPFFFFSSFPPLSFPSLSFFFYRELLVLCTSKM